MTTTTIPTIPSGQSPAALLERSSQLALARTSYNYMFSYLEGVSLSADSPPQESFSPDYEAKVLLPFLEMADNFVKVVLLLAEKELRSDFPPSPIPAVQAVEKAWKEYEASKEGFHPLSEAEALAALLKALAGVPASLESAIKGVERLPPDLEKLFNGITRVFQQFQQQGPTAFLRSTMYEVLAVEQGRDYLQATSIDDYAVLYQTLPPPLSMTLPPQDWMMLSPGEKPWEQDWYFGYLQIAGFNTTILEGVTDGRRPGGVTLSALRQKLPVTDQMLQKAIGDRSLTLEAAAAAGRLYVCDYEMLQGIPSGQLHDKERHHGAPIALFYWNPAPPRGYPPIAKGAAGGVMQPVAIQLEQSPDPQTNPIFQPGDGSSWQIAKFFVNNACAVQHEAVAHLGACHLTIEPMVVATHRQLAEVHPVYLLLIPHFRFTIEINDSALHSLIVPKGVVASVLSTTLEGSETMIQRARLAWRFDENRPDQLFKLRGVDAEMLPDFPFRDDTLLLWKALRSYVSSYVDVYYAEDADVTGDRELQGWVNELVNPARAGMGGMGGLVWGGPGADATYQIQSKEYLKDVLAEIIYIAGPQHASVNYAQYPLMSYLPSVSGTAYQPPPTSTEPLDYVSWLPPLDVSLYQLSFGYLLSSVQYDTLGYYSADPRRPYFADPRVEEVVIQLQHDLAVAELAIRERNRSRPFPYLLQLPSRIPNSISI